MKFNDFDEIYDDIDDEQVTSDIKRRNRQLTVDLWATGWGQMLRNETINDPNSFLGKKFRRRFRLPYALFQKVTALCIEKGIFKSKHRSPIPI